MLETKEHYDLMDAFEKQYSIFRMEKEPKETWAKNRIYQDGTVNALFIAYRNGYAVAKAIYQN